ncbi:MAG TPA: alpha/beta hydrolase [Stellaceae bacterium]|nr:alpha/beta hydrolase [Stellaceae bacterium]
MPHLTADDGVRLYYEEAGTGTPIVFVHEFAGDHRSWELQLRFFSRRYRCIAYNARGYPPSDVPADAARYSQDRARDDIRAVLDALKLEKAHVVGLSMGGFATLHFGMHYADRALSIVVAGCGYGAEPGKRQQFQAESEQTAKNLQEKGMAEVAPVYAMGPTRVQYLNKDPRGFTEFARQLAEHSTTGSALTLLGVQRMRPSLYDLQATLAKMTLPTLVVTGDEDWPCLEPGLYLKRVIPSAALVVIPNSGHVINLEEPALFNQAVADFFHQVEHGRWPQRDPRAMAGTILGTR